MPGSMTDFWEAVIAPHLQRATPAMITLVGARDTGLAARLVDATAAWGAAVHVIEPALLPDEGTLRARGADRVTVHRANGQDALPLLPVADLLLLDMDADPNWYTVQTLLCAAAAQAARLRRQFPLTLLTNTAWPYARRDSYASPAAIPEKFRQTHETAGVRPRQGALCASRGLFAGRTHAAAEHGPRNGVLTALEDFAAAEAGRVSYVTLPLLHGISMIHDAAAGSDGVRALRAAMEMGPAAHALAEAIDLDRHVLAGDIADLRRELAARDYLADLLRSTLDAERKKAAQPRGLAQISAAATQLPRLASAARRKSKRLARHVLWAARGQLGARLAEQRARDEAAAGIARLRASPIFDAAWYVQTYGDVAATGADPVAHFYHHGAVERRDPGPLFSSGYYLDRYGDVAESGVNPLLHYLHHGASEGRDPSPFFSSAYYVQQAPGATNPLEHYITTGLVEGRRPMPPAR